jgi:hypothetical protein
MRHVARRRDRLTDQTLMTLPGDDDHALKNHLAIILGYAELLLQDSAADDPRRADFEEIYRAAVEAVKLVSARQKRDA